MHNHTSRASTPDPFITLQNAHGMRVTVSEYGAALVSWMAPDRYGVSAEVIVAQEAPRQRWTATLLRHGVSLRFDEAQVDYYLDDEGALSIEGQARLPLFNLNGGRACVGDHMLQIQADAVVQGGVLMPVAASALDFRRSAAIGPRLVWPDPRLQRAGGFDHSYRLEAQRDAARVAELRSGRELLVSTSAEELRFVCANALDGIGFAAPDLTLRIAIR